MTQIKPEVFNELLGITESYQAPPRESISEFTFAIYAMCGVKHPELDNYLEVLEAQREAGE